MTTTSDMNIIVGQGTAIKEVHNVKKQNLEANHQFVAQHSEGQKKKDKSTVQKFDKKSRVETKGDQEKEHQRRQKNKKRGSSGESLAAERSLSEGKLIDITV